MYNFKEKKHHFNALRNQDAAGYDLELLEKENPAEPQLETFRRNPKRYADDILYALLDCVSREKIRDNRRNLMEKENLNIEDDGIQSMNADPAENPDETTSSEDVETRIREAVKAKEEAEARAEEAEEAKEDAEQRAEEAEEAKEDAEQRAEEAEQALEKEKKKAPAKSKSKKNTRK